MFDERFHEGAELDGVTLEGLALEREIFEGVSFRRCVLRGARLAHATFRECSFEECRLEGCDLSNARLDETKLAGVRFEGCKLLGVDWTRAAAFGLELSFERCILSYGNFTGMRLRKLRAIGCTALETTFSGANLTECDLSGTDLQGSMFVRTDLTRADLSAAERYLVDPRSSILSGTKMSVDGWLRAGALLGIDVPALHGE